MSPGRPPAHRAALVLNSLALAGYLAWMTQSDTPLWRGADGLLHTLPLLVFFLVYVAVLRE